MRAMPQGAGGDLEDHSRAAECEARARATDLVCDAVERSILGLSTSLYRNPLPRR